MKRLLLLACIGAIAACSSNDHPGYVQQPDGGETSGGAGGKTTGSGGGAGKGTSGAGGGEIEAGVPGAPSVSITSPEAVNNPDVGHVLIDSTVEVLCQVTPSPDPGAPLLNKSTISIEMLDGTGKSLETDAAEPTSNADEYSSQFGLTGIPNGVVAFRCTASDRSTPPLTGSDTLSTMVDHGPTIIVTSPMPDSAQSLKKPVNFEFSVEAAPLADGDMGALVGDVTLKTDGVDIPLTESPTQPGLFQTNVDYGDPLLFAVAPTGSVSVVITATNRRTPTPATSAAPYVFDIDGVGPVITINLPTAGQILGGNIALQFTVDDAAASGNPNSSSGVKASTVFVQLDELDPIYYDPSDPIHWGLDVSGTKFVYRFDSTEFRTQPQINVDVGAEDNAGNLSIGQAITIFLDNVPPIVDLDPPMIREIQASVSDGPPYMGMAMTPTSYPDRCSAPFDPLGSAVNDLASVKAIALYRAFVFDLTNDASGQIFHHFAAVDQGSVRLYVQPDPTLPVLIDTDNDGICDAIPDGLRFQAMLPIPPDSRDPPLNGDDLSMPPAVAGLCGFGPKPVSVTQLCEPAESDLIHVVKHPMPKNPPEPVVYGIGPIDGVACTGHDWQLANLIPLVDPADPQGPRKEGWVCLAARATDNAGNTGVSPPLRVCFDDDRKGGTPGCRLNPAMNPPPTCTDGCRVPSGYTNSLLVR
jgi:hypothetical protein